MQIILFREMGKESNETFLEPYAVIDTITNEWVIETMDIERKVCIGLDLIIFMLID